MAYHVEAMIRGQDNNRSQHECDLVDDGYTLLCQGKPDTRRKLWNIKSLPSWRP